jgi:vancomycin resistance protein YoaR
VVPEARSRVFTTPGSLYRTPAKLVKASDDLVFDRMAPEKGAAALGSRVLSMPGDMARHRAHINGWLWILPSLAIPFAVSGVAWANHVAGEGEVIAPNVWFAGIDMSGLTVEEAAAHVGWREVAVVETPVTIDLGVERFTMSAGEIGFDYLYTDTVEQMVAARHAETAWEEFASWANTPLQTVTVEDVITLDADTARERLSRGDLVLENPVEPSLVDKDGEISVVPGVEGLGIDIEHLIELLEDADITSGPMEIGATTTALLPEVTDPAAQAAADELNALTENGMTTTVAGVTRQVGPQSIRRSLKGEVSEGEMKISLDVDGFQQTIERIFPGPQGEMTKPVLVVEDGEVRVVAEGVPAPVCCTTESVRAAADDLLNGGSPRYELMTRPNDDERVIAWAKGSDVIEPVAEFTTHHACCENRVSNIHTMADAVRGYYLVPGETLSFNEFIGPRTREKGYLPAGAIRGGHMTDEVGGGVSQFVTTMFNAAFFGGLDLDEYQSHSVYFSRYPFGREATLSNPWPDLVITNSTEYPVLIWPTYDATSITVTLYSTRHIEVEEVAHRVSNRNLCRHSEIDRQRTYPDGRVVVDTIEANYRPGDGIDCNGREIPPPRT